MHFPPATRLSAAQIGRCGELLVQYLLLGQGVESAPLSTDTGIDLVAYAPGKAEAFTIQVKTNLRPKPSGGRGKPALDWWMPELQLAQLAALVDLSTQRVWLMRREQLSGVAQQRSNGRFHFYMYTESSYRSKDPSRKIHSHQFERFLIERCAPEIFGLGSAPGSHDFDVKEVASVVARL